MAMLSRVADSLYWMGRYLERAEQIARQLEVTRDILVDLVGPDPDGAKAEWQATLASLSVPNLSLQRLVFDATEPSSLSGCVGQARENARQVREVIANEMWQEINQTHWRLIETRDEPQDETAMTNTLSDTLKATATWDGLSDAAMHRGEAWVFLKLGKWIERLDRTGRVLVARSHQSAQTQSATKDNVISVVMLKSIGALEAYRKLSPTRIDRHTVLDFLMFQPGFPRSLLFCALEVSGLAGQLAQICRGVDAAVGRNFGRLSSRLEHGDIDEVMQTDPQKFLQEVLADVAQANAVLQRSFFLT